jgi:DNA-binding response OmpR family regulator
MRILVVEDDLFLALLLQEMLLDLNQAVVGPAHGVATALELAAAHPIDLALVDIQLDAEDDGVLLACRLRDAHGLPSIFVSGRAELPAGAHEAACGLLRKPCTLDVLAQTLRFVEDRIGGNPAAVAPAALELLAGKLG